MGRGSNDSDWSGPTSDIVNKVYPDVLVRNEGSVFLFTPLTRVAKQWIAENVQLEAQWFDEALVVEHRCALGLRCGCVRLDWFFRESC